VVRGAKAEKAQMEREETGRPRLSLTLRVEKKRTRGVPVRAQLLLSPARAQ